MRAAVDKAAGRVQKLQEDIDEGRVALEKAAKELTVAVAEEEKIVRKRIPAIQPVAGCIELESLLCEGAGAISIAPGAIFLEAQADLSASDQEAFKAQVKLLEDKVAEVAKANLGPMVEALRVFVDGNKVLKERFKKKRRTAVGAVAVGSGGAGGSPGASGGGVGAVPAGAAATGSGGGAAAAAGPAGAPGGGAAPSGGADAAASDKKEAARKKLVEEAMEKAKQSG